MRLVEFLTARRTRWPTQYNSFNHRWHRLNSHLRRSEKILLSLANLLIPTSALAGGRVAVGGLGEVAGPVVELETLLF